MKYVAVVPYTYRPYFDEFMATSKINTPENTLFINNTTPELNRGVMRSHNMGIDFMKRENADWLIIISPAIRFGEAGGLDFLKILGDHPDYHVIHGASANVEGGKQADPEGGGHNKVFGWHLMAIHHTVFEAIGRYDENFTPYGFDDIDLSLRIRKHFKEATRWDTFPCDVTDTIMGHSLHYVPEVVGEASSTPRIAYFVEKWGRHPGAYQLGEYDRPFNNPEYGLDFWPPASNGGHYDG